MLSSIFGCGSVVRYVQSALKIVRIRSATARLEAPMLLPGRHTEVKRMKHQCRMLVKMPDLAAPWLRGAAGLEISTHYRLLSALVVDPLFLYLHDNGHYESTQLLRIQEIGRAHV